MYTAYLVIKLVTQVLKRGPQNLTCRRSRGNTCGGTAKLNNRSCNIFKYETRHEGQVYIHDKFHILAAVKFMKNVTIRPKTIKIIYFSKVDSDGFYRDIDSTSLYSQPVEGMESSS